jgi:hypothetical protein
MKVQRKTAVFENLSTQYIRGNIISHISSFNNFLGKILIKMKSQKTNLKDEHTNLEERK